MAKTPKIIQIQTAQNFCNAQVVIALCDDGTLWFTAYEGSMKPFRDWKKLDGPSVEVANA